MQAFEDRNASQCLYNGFTICSRTLFSRKTLRTIFKFVSRVFKGFLEIKVLENEVNNVYGDCNIGRIQGGG